jgi:hypothetical protein
MKIGDLVKHTPTGGFVIVLDRKDGAALICFTSGGLVGYKQWYSTNYLEVINEDR